MPSQNKAFKERLSKSSEITITVTGRKSGRPVSIPVWFVFDDDKLNLLPVKGSDTQWYKNVLKNPSLPIDAGGQLNEAEFITDASKWHLS
jgi:deazaflavin-dependent oxidoreductase (nitroreductase family)